SATACYAALRDSHLVRFLPMLFMTPTALLERRSCAKPLIIAIRKPDIPGPRLKNARMPRWKSASDNGNPRLQPFLQLGRTCSVQGGRAPEKPGLRLTFFIR